MSMYSRGKHVFGIYMASESLLDTSWVLSHAVSSPAARWLVGLARWGGSGARLEAKLYARLGRGYARDEARGKVTG